MPLSPPRRLYRKRRIIFVPSPEISAPIMESGFTTRVIGRFRRYWSPVRVARKTLPRKKPGEKPDAGPGIAQVEGAFGRLQSLESDAVYNQFQPPRPSISTPIAVSALRY